MVKPIVKKRFALLWAILATAVSIALCIVLLVYCSDERRFNFSRLFSIRLGMPIHEFNAHHGLSLGPGNNVCDKVVTFSHGGFKLVGVRVGEFGHTVERFDVVRSFPSNEYETAASVFAQMSVQIGSFGWKRMKNREIPDMPDGFHCDFWQRMDERFGSVQATAVLFREGKEWIVGYSESLGHEEAYKVFMREVDDLVAQSQFDPISPFGVSLTNVCETLRLVDKELVDWEHGIYPPLKIRMSNPGWKRLQVDRGYDVTLLAFEKQSGWASGVRFARNFAQNDRQAKAEYAALGKQISCCASNIIEDYSCALPPGTVKYDCRIACYGERLIRYIPRLMQLSDSTSSVWSVRLDIDVWQRRRN